MSVFFWIMTALYILPGLIMGPLMCLVPLDPDSAWPMTIRSCRANSGIQSRRAARRGFVDWLVGPNSVR